MVDASRPAGWLYEDRAAQSGIVHLMRQRGCPSAEVRVPLWLGAEAGDGGWPAGTIAPWFIRHCSSAHMPIFSHLAGDANITFAVENATRNPSLRVTFPTPNTQVLLQYSYRRGEVGSVVAPGTRGNLNLQSDLDDIIEKAKNGRAQAHHGSWTTPAAC